MVRLPRTMLATVLTQQISAMGLESGIGQEITVPAQDCAAHFVAGGALCGEVVMPCAVAAPVMALLTDFEAGRCKDVTDSLKQVDTVSFAGMNLTSYVGNFAGNDDKAVSLTLPTRKCAVHLVAGGAFCGEIEMSCLMKAPLKLLLKSFQDGHCMDFGNHIKQIETKSIAGFNISAYVGFFGGKNDSSVSLMESQSGKLESQWPPLPGFHCTVYNEASDYGIPCGEVDVRCEWVPLMKLLRPFKSGKCSDVGYAVQTHAATVPFTLAGNVTFTIYDKIQASEERCKVSLAAGVVCGQLDATCDLIPALKDFVGFEDGECSANSFKAVPGTTGPVIEGQDDVIFTAFIDKALPLPDISGQTCSIWDEGDKFAALIGVPCGEMQLDCSLVEHMKTLRESFKDGVCADGGYTKNKMSHTFWIPLAGDVVMTIFDKEQDLLV